MLNFLIMTAIPFNLENWFTKEDISLPRIRYKRNCYILISLQLFSSFFLQKKCFYSIFFHKILQKVDDSLIRRHKNNCFKNNGKEKQVFQIWNDNLEKNKLTLALQDFPPKFCCILKHFIWQLIKKWQLRLKRKESPG